MHKHSKGRISMLDQTVVNYLQLLSINKDKSVVSLLSEILTILFQEIQLH